jgi:hypothetical protein
MSRPTFVLCLPVDGNVTEVWKDDEGEGCGSFQNLLAEQE